MAPRLPQAGETEASAPRDLGLQRLSRPGCWPLRSDRPRAVSGAFLPPGKDNPLGRGPHAPRSLTPSSRPRTRGVRSKGLTCRLSTRGVLGVVMSGAPYTQVSLSAFRPMVRQKCHGRRPGGGKLLTSSQPRSRKERKSHVEDFEIEGCCLDLDLKASPGIKALTMSG